MLQSEFITRLFHIILASVYALMLTACGTTPQQTIQSNAATITLGSTDSNTPSNQSSMAHALNISLNTNNMSPTITGTPMTTLMSGNTYEFSPTAGDDDGDTLAFSIVNKPDWAIFNTATGQLSGTPTTTGSYSNIVISVSDGTITAELNAFTITVQPRTGSALLNWTAPSQNTDGSSLTDLIGYVIYYGTSANSNELTDSMTVSDSSATTATIEGLTPGTTYYFAIASVSAIGGEGNKSDLASKTI